MHIHEIDFHYHAGQERQPDVTLADHLEHARVTGRRVLGLTDHLQFFLSEHEISPERASRFPYERSLDGLARYRQDMDEAKAAYSDLELYFGPEVPPKIQLEQIPDRVLKMSDFFICECAFSCDVSENTQTVVARIEEIGAFVAATGKPTFLAHPFRSAVNHRLVKRDIEPWVTAIEPREGRDFPVQLVNELYCLDVDAVGEVAQRTGVPLEVNGNTQYRVRASNLPATLQALWCALERLASKGAAFVPGSDQHGFRSGVGRIGGYVPFDCFTALRLGVEDIRFLDDVRDRAATPPFTCSSSNG